MTNASATLKHKLYIFHLNALLLHCKNLPGHRLIYSDLLMQCTCYIAVI